jgi:hypothetical protein
MTDFRRNVGGPGSEAGPLTSAKTLLFAAELYDEQRGDKLARKVAKNRLSFLY